MSQKLVPGHDGNTIGPAVEIFADATAMADLIRGKETSRLQSTLAVDWTSLEEQHNE